MSPPRRLYLLEHAITFIGMVFIAMPVFSKPLPLPLLMAADYSPNLVPFNRSISRVASRNARPFPLVTIRHSRDVESLAALTQFYNGAETNAKNLKALAGKSATTDNDDYDYQQAYVSQFSEFNQNMQGIQESLAQAATSDRGLGNYDQDNNLETVLKNLVNANKKVLNATAATVYNIPCLGPTLGPIVYDLKCLVDQILDALEDCSDALVNQLTPLLQSIFGDAVTPTCDTGVIIAGLCI